MIFTTLQYNGVEKPLADWGIGAAQREVSNQAHDHVACDLMLAADTADPIPYGGQIILRIGRSAIVAGSLPPSGLTAFSGGAMWFVGWRVETFRSGSPALEKFSYKFAGPWEFFFERLIFQKLFFTYNGTANVADWRSQVILGQSINSLVGAQDTIPATNATNLMSIRQQVAEIIAYVVNQTTTDFGSPQIQSDTLAADTNGNYLLNSTYPGGAYAAGTKLLIPDYIASVYAIAGQSSAGQTQTGSTPAKLTTVLRAPLDSVNDITCAEAMRRMLKWIGPVGEAVIWFDYTTTNGGSPCPSLRISTRDQLAAVSVPMVGQNAGFKIKRRDDLIPGCVALKFRVTTTSSEQTYTEVINDIAGTVGGAFLEGIGLTGALYTVGTFATGTPAYIGGSANSATMQALQAAGRDFAAVSQTIDMEGSNSHSARCLIGTMPVNINDPSMDSTAISFWQKLFPEFKTLAATPNLVAGSGVTVTVDNPANQNSSQPGDGVAVNLSLYQYLLTDGQVAPWMLAGNVPGGAGAQVVQAVINAKFVVNKTTVITVGGSSVNLSSGVSPYQEKTARVTLVSIPGGLYQTLTGFAPGEVIPYGLAGYIYSISQIPQYEGTFTLQETEITDECPMGHNFNITGGLAEWATMSACVQSISYDLTNARTTLTFGPSAHLGAKDLVERLRSNRNPIRPYYGNGGNVTNNPDAQAGAQLGNSVAQRGPSPGMEHSALTIMPVSLSDWAAHRSSYATGVPGINCDTRPGGQPNYGNISGLSSPNAPTVHLQGGSGGTSSLCIRISIADLLGSNKQAWFQPVGICVNVGGIPTPKTIYVLCTAPE